MGHRLVRIVGIMALMVLTVTGADESEKKEGTVYIHIIKQQGNKVLLQPITPAVLGFSLDNGDLAGQKFLQCDLYRVMKEDNNVRYPVLQLRCSGILMTLDDVLMTEPK